MTFELTDEMLAKWPPDAQALIRLLLARVAELDVQVAELRGQLAEARGKTPQNSSLPPSTTHPHAKPMSVKPKSKRSRGGQPGHDKHERALIPVEACRDVVPCVPRACRRCGRKLSGRDPEPLRHQVWELPEIKPIVTEYQRHRLVCACGCSTCGDLPPGVPTGQAGPRLIAFSGLLMACFRQSKRRAALFLSTILNQPASAAWMVLLQNRGAEAVQPAYDELAAQLPAQEVLNIDESPTKEGPSKAWVWTFVAATFTFFACRTSRAADVLQDLLGEAYDGIIHCDRARMYWRFGRLQWCWAHLKRDFQALIDDPCATSNAWATTSCGRRKRCSPSGRGPRRHPHARTFERRMKPIRREIDALLLRGYFNPLTRGFCKELVEHGEHLWTFVTSKALSRPTTPPSERCVTPSSGGSCRSARSRRPAAASSNDC